MAGRIKWKTERLSSYTQRVVEHTTRAAQELVIRAEVLLQRKIRHFTPKDTSELYDSIQMQHKGRRESVRATVAGHEVSVTNFIQPIARTPAGRRIKLLQPSTTVRPRELEGSVYTDLPRAPHVEYDTGIYNDKNGNKPILPKPPNRALRFVTKSGEVVYVASVKGYKGKHMFAKGSAFVGAGQHIPNQSRDIMSKWRARGMIVRPK